MRALCTTHPAVDYEAEWGCPVCLRALRIENANQQATIDRLTAQLALAVEAGTAYLTTVYQHNDFCNQRECDCGTEDREGADLAKLLTALRFTDPDIDAAVQAMQAGRRVLDQEWLVRGLRTTPRPEVLADAIIALLKEAQ